MRKPKKLLGNELLLPTDAGEVRVIGCNLDNPQTLPLFVDMHGDGFVLGHAEMDDPFMARVAEANLAPAYTCWMQSAMSWA